MPLTAPYAPVELTKAQEVFPADALEYMPALDDIPDDFDKYSHPWQIQLQRDWFYKVIEDLQVIPHRHLGWGQDDIDRAFRHLNAIQASYAPKHEHKELAVAFLVNQWFSHARWQVDGKWHGYWPEELQGVTLEEAEAARHNT